MIGRTKKAYIKILGNEHSFDECLSDHDILKILRYYDRHINFNNTNFLNKFLLCERNYPKLRDLYHFFKDIINCKSCSTVSNEFWKCRGWHDNEIKEMVSKDQRKRSKRCVEYWISKGFSIDDAKSKVSDYQRRNCKITNQKRQKSYYIGLGYSDEEAEQIANSINDRLSAFRKQFWIDRGYSDKDAERKIKSISGNNSKEFLKQKFGSKYMERYNEICDHKRSASLGCNNPMFGKPAPNGSGFGISGTYKGIYFRSIPEYIFLRDHLNRGLDIISNDVLATTFSDKVRIKYKFGEKLRSYSPDFICQKTIIEIKNSYSIKTSEWKAKEQALSVFVKNSDKYKRYVVIIGDNLTMPKDVIWNDYKLGDLVIDSGKLKRFIKIYES